MWKSPVLTRPELLLLTNIFILTTVNCSHFKNQLLKTEKSSQSCAQFSLEARHFAFRDWIELNWIEADFLLQICILLSIVDLLSLILESEDHGHFIQRVHTLGARCFFFFFHNREILRFTFTPKGRREFVPHDQGFPLFSVYPLLLLHRNM